MEITDLGFKKTAASYSVTKGLLNSLKASGRPLKRGRKSKLTSKSTVVSRKSKSPRNELIQTVTDGNKGSLAKRRRANARAIKYLKLRETPKNVTKSVTSFKGFVKGNYPKMKAVRKRIVGNEFLDAAKSVATNTSLSAAGAGAAGGRAAARSAAATSLKFEGAAQGAKAAWRSVRKPDKQQLRRVLTQKPELRKKPWEI